jgi:16S rRNA processing protein RimM
VIVELWSDFPDRLDSGSELETDEGTLEVIASRLHQGRYMVAFRGFSTRESAEGLVGLVLRAEPRDVPDALWIHDLIGCEVLTVEGAPVGRVEGVEANPASDLLVLDDGRLIPLHFLVSHEPGVRIVIDPPEGLLEL